MVRDGQDDEIAGAMYRDMKAERVEEYVKGPLEQLIHYEGGRAFLSASDDLLMLLVFTYVDLLGYLFKGKSKSIYAVEFIRKYYGEVDRRYTQVGGLLYDALRHGMVHLAVPKRIKLEDGKLVDFLFIRSGQRADYLKMTKQNETQSSGDTVVVYRLTLDLPLLYGDLLSAIDSYVGDIKANQELSDTFCKAFRTRRESEATEAELRRRSYIQQSDFDFVRAHMSNL